MTWAAEYGAPLMFIEGWDPDSGEWAETSPVGKMLARIRKGAPISSAARRYDVRRIGDLLRKGRDFLADSTISEDRDLIPLDARPFIDLALSIDEAETECELTIAEMYYEAAVGTEDTPGDPTKGMVFLGRRYPENWREQRELVASVEYDPRKAAMDELLSDPNTSAALADLADRALDKISEE